MSTELMSTPDARKVFENNQLADLLCAIELGNVPDVAAPSLTVDINSEGERGLTPLMWAVGRRSVPAVRWLVVAGADVSVTSSKGSGWTALHQAAAMSGSSDAIRALLALGADPDMLSGHSSETALATSIMRGLIEPLRVLLELGANPDRKDEVGDTSLHIAAGIGDHDMVLALLNSGADPELTNNRGDSFRRLFFVSSEHSLTAEARAGRQQVVGWLETHGYSSARE